MEARRRTWFDPRGLNIAGRGMPPAGSAAEWQRGSIAGRPLPFYAGAMHYWRVPPAQWAPCLRAMHALGLTIVETYVPWRVHEPTAGQRLWTGQHDLARFLGAAQAAGLSVVLRPGPHVNAELTSFGIPDWVLSDPACQARTAAGTPAWMPSPPRAFPIPSYASVKFRERVGAWYATVAEIVQSHLAPDGPVVAIGVDNEAQLFFRSGAFDLDYHPDALEWWRDASGLDEPPRAWNPQDAARCALWMKFKDEYIARALAECCKLLDKGPLGDLARFHNLPPGHYQLYDLRRIQNAIGGPVGIDAYTPRAMFPELRRRALALVGNAAPVPIAFEVGVGFLPWLPPLDGAAPPFGGAGVRGHAPAADRSAPPFGGADGPSVDVSVDVTRERDHLLTLLAAGVRGFNLFMAVERDRYYGAAIDQRGQVEAHASWIKPLIAALAEIDWPGLHRPAPIALVDMRADERFGIASCLVDPMTPVLSDMIDLGPGGATELGTDPGAIAARRWQIAIARALDLAQVPYVIIDESATEDELARFRAVIAPTGERIGRGLWQTLRAVAEHKRSVVVIGPGTPTRDELDQPLGEAAPKRIGRLKQGSLDDLAGLAEDLAQLVGDPAESWRIERPADVRATRFAGADGRVRVVFVTSDNDRAVTAILLPDPTVAALRDPFTHEHLHVADGRIAIAMHARGVRMLIIEHVVAS